MSARVRFRNPYGEWIVLPQEDFVADHRDRLEAETARGWRAERYRRDALAHAIAIYDEQGRKLTGLVVLSHVEGSAERDAEASPNGWLQATTELSGPLAERVKGDATLERAAHAMLASEFVGLLLTDYTHLGPIEVVAEPDTRMLPTLDGEERRMLHALDGRRRPTVRANPRSNA